MLDFSFELLEHNGIESMKDVYIGIFQYSVYSPHVNSCSLNLIYRKINSSDFSKFAIYIRSNTSSYPPMPENTSMESLFSFDPSAKAAIFFVYNYLSSLQKISLAFLKSAWENDLGLVITEDQWENALKKVHTTSICIRHGLV